MYVFTLADFLAIPCGSCSQQQISKILGFLHHPLYREGRGHKAFMDSPSVSVSCSLNFGGGGKLWVEIILPRLCER